MTWAGLNILSLPDDEIKKLKDFQEKVFDEVAKQVEEWGIEKNEKGGWQNTICIATKPPAHIAKPKYRWLQVGG